jgi:two-component system chemotaxis response regulator CheB
MIKVLIVDDSALMRKHLNSLLEQSGEFTVKYARNGVEALAELEAFDPDVITLDINMPEMDGITCLSRIMAIRPKPVLMVSSLTEQGAEATLQAMSLGAIDYVHKPGGTISLSIEQIERELITKIRAAARAKLRHSIGLRSRISQERGRASMRASARSMSARAAAQSGIVLIGVSTGGPGTLEHILPELPADFPWAVIVAQHMPGTFTGVFARRLDEACRLPVLEVNRQMPIETGHIYIAKGDADLVILRRGEGYSASPVPASKDYLWQPSVHRMVTSAIQVVPADQLVGVLLTGMGSDGADAMTEMHNRGSLTIAQDEASCVVFGMPNELIRRGGATIILPSQEIASQLIALVAGAGKPAGKQLRAR